MSVTHVAGPMVGLVKLDRAVQRCALCGYKLEDFRPSRIAVASTAGAPDQIPQFPERHLIRVSGDNPRHFIVLGDFVDTDLPEDFCLALVEE
jgi:hypothetical protein